MNIPSGDSFCTKVQHQSARPLYPTAFWSRVKHKSSAQVLVVKQHAPLGRKIQGCHQPRRNPESNRSAGRNCIFQAFQNRSVSEKINIDGSTTQQQARHGGIMNHVEVLQYLQDHGNDSRPALTWQPCAHREYLGLVRAEQTPDTADRTTLEKVRATTNQRTARISVEPHAAGCT